MSLKLHLILAVAIIVSSGLPAVAARHRVQGPSRTWKLLFVRDGDTRIADGDGSRQHRIIKNGTSPCWAPDHHRLAFSREGNLWIASADGNGQRQLTHWKPEDQELQIAWGPTPREITFARREQWEIRRPGQPPDPIVTSTLWETSLDSARTNAVMDVTTMDAGYNFGGYEWPAWSATGLGLAFACNGDLWTAQRRPKKSKELPDIHSWPGWWLEGQRSEARAEYDLANDRADHWGLAVHRISWSPRGRRLVYGVSRVGGMGFDQVHLADWKPDGISFTLLHDHLLANWASDPCFSPDGRFVAYVDHTGHAITITSLDGRYHHRAIPGGSQPAW